MVRTYWREQHADEGFEEFWKRSLHDGVVADTPIEMREVTLQGNFLEPLEGTFLPSSR